LPSARPLSLLSSLVPRSTDGFSRSSDAMRLVKAATTSRHFDLILNE
jgi:hypothetical protein